MPENEHGDQTKSLQGVWDEHGHLAPNAIGDRSPENAPGAIEKTANNQRRGERGSADVETSCHRRSLHGNHRTAYADHDKRDKEQIELGSQQHFKAVELHRVTPDLGRQRFLGDGRNFEFRTRIMEILSSRQNYKPLANARI